MENNRKARRDYFQGLTTEEINEFKRSACQKEKQQCIYYNSGCTLAAKRACASLSRFKYKKEAEKQRAIKVLEKERKDAFLRNDVLIKSKVMPEIEKTLEFLNSIVTTRNVPLAMKSKALLLIESLNKI